MADPLQDIEIRRLLTEADNTRALFDQTGGQDTAMALAGIYHDLGRALHLACGTARPPIQRRHGHRANSLPPTLLHDWADSLDDEEVTVVDLADEDEDAGIVSRKGRR